jgi:drug/metabolite transporter (DMT)-like permease
MGLLVKIIFALLSSVAVGFVSYILIEIMASEYFNPPMVALFIFLVAAPVSVVLVVLRHGKRI